MAKIQNNTYQTKPKSSCFLGCFGFPGEVSKKKSLQETVGSGGRKKTRWFSWSRFRMKKSATKTVPVDVTVSEKAGRNNEIRVSKSDKLTSRCQISDTGHQPMSQIPAVVPVASNEITLIEKPRKTRYGTAQSINLENRKQLDHLDSPKKDTCQKRLSLCRKTEGKRTQDSNSGSPEIKSMTGRTAVMSHSASFPPPKRSKQAPDAAGHSQVDVEKPHRKNDTLTGKFNPIIGMSIIMVTLIIMLFWGRLCAILCTSAWLYFVPGLRIAVKSDEIAENNLNSEEYKKKVVLEGFLERNRRNSFGIL